MEGRKENKWTDGWMKDRRKDNQIKEKNGRTGRRMDGKKEKQYTDGWMKQSMQMCSSQCDMNIMN